ncbi:MAG: sigma-70 family RNA polymerase sigma factor [Bacteroidales bacterium]|nr:sigma-70 family RNA polymerase sigma factor [Bacteroidales bacterium]
MSESNYIEILYNKYVDDMYAYALFLGFPKEIIMDAIHDVFYKVHVNKVSFEKIRNPKFYLFCSLKNRLIDICRKKRDYLELTENSGEMGKSAPFTLHVTIEDEMIRTEDLEEIAQKVEKILNSLTNRQKEIIYHRYINEYSYEEIAELMQISVPACRNLHSKSMAKLKVIFNPALSSVRQIIFFI